MRLLAVLLILTAPAFAQVPLHSVVGGVTIDVADISIPVPYGPAETRALVTQCSTDEISQVQFTITYFGQDPGIELIMQASVSTVKVNGSYCASVMAPVERAKVD